jgi:hypothetical protein
LLAGGNTDGVSGPGVGSVIIFVHEGGVGIIIFGVGVDRLVGDSGVAPQAVTNVDKRKIREICLLTIR